MTQAFHKHIKDPLLRPGKFIWNIPLSDFTILRTNHNNVVNYNKKCYIY